MGGGNSCWGVTLADDGFDDADEGDDPTELQNDGVKTGSWKLVAPAAAGVGGVSKLMTGGRKNQGHQKLRSSVIPTAGQVYSAKELRMGQRKPYTSTYCSFNRQTTIYKAVVHIRDERLL